MYRTGPISPLHSWLTSDLLCYRFRTAIGHYTAMVWSNTNRVGCGLTEFREGKWFAKLYTCNYGPSGNYIGGQMYANGPACSKCPEGTSCSATFPGLCGEIGKEFPRFAC